MRTTVWVGAFLAALFSTACGSGSGGGINYNVPACSGSYDTAKYQLAAEFNGSECAFFLGVADKGSGEVVCECPQPAANQYCGAQVPAFSGACPAQ